jgi:biopolymer transport protein ExbB
VEKRTKSLLAIVFCAFVLSAGWQGFAQTPEPAALPEEVEALTLLDLVMNGGWIMVPIGALSVIALLLILFYSFTITERSLVPKKFLRKVYDLVNQGNFADAQALCEKVHGLLPRMLAAGLRRREMGILAVSDAMAGAGTREIERYRQWIRYLSDIAAISPMLGLLGTIIGMINAFKVVAAGASVVNPMELAGAVSMALVTTAAGLIVAIPTMGFYYYFRGRLVRISTQVEEKGSEFAERITGSRPQQGFLQEAVNARR